MPHARWGRRTGYELLRSGASRKAGTVAAILRCLAKPYTGRNLLDRVKHALAKSADGAQGREWFPSCDSVLLAPVPSALG